ncbi:Rab3 GTPase-activating protein catalytic subunit-domain-containing protein [Syncephalastrum racemosum]|uniref:Rab3 GTPase-activating protein catalytic subunit n=1 Tax=Syncephalastrum racemosum TaxID=13706 RepID=A0A1X2HQG5_SYNRA|nr:Rab3 GTPase-activating protein catalytic subunit-domain-containing protein [Syncephalastrum racemosum]
MASLSDYADGLNETDMDALTAQHWRLGVELAPYSQQRCFLSSLLDTMLTSWIRDPANRDYLPPYDASNREEHKETNPGLMRNLFHAIGPRPPTMQPSPAPSIVPDQMEQIMQTLFTPMDATEQQHLPSPLYSPAALGYRLKHGSPVPVQSFLYLFMQQILLVSDNSKSSMVMLKMVWMEAVRRIRWHWDNHVEIPNVDVSLYGRKGLKDSSETLRQHDYESVEGIDLRYNILHQKLTMLNCCIHRRAREGERPQKGRTDYVSSLFDDIGSPSKSKMDRFNTFVERLVEGDQEDIKEDDEDQKNDETEDNGEEIKSIASSSEGDIFFDSMEDIGDESRNNRASSQRSQSDKQPQRPPQKPWSRTSSLSDVSEVAHPHSMTESFVRLNYPSSAESYPPPAKPYRAEDFVDEDAAAEVKDPEVSEGRLRPHEDLTLLETGEPLFIPVTQESGFMTEDMISQQADVFEKMGTSEDAAQSRAKMQSRHLRSDMEAFKAANPHATLEDFVRWHSPRDWVESARKEDEEGEQVRGAGGHLSARMTAPGNLWLEIWKNARRIPVCRQKPLFDARTEGEKVTQMYSHPSCLIQCARHSTS